MTYDDLKPDVAEVRQLRQRGGIGLGEAKRMILRDTLGRALLAAERLPDAERLETYGAVLKHLVEHL